MTNPQPTTTKVNHLLQAALQYASQELEVFPIKKRQKAPPLTMNGLKDATTDPAQIKKWWGMWPDSNIGIRCTGLLVADFDGKIGAESKAELEAKFGKLPPTWTIKTGGGTKESPKEQGLHYVEKVSKELNIRPGAGKYGHPGFDIRANDSYIVAAPSVTRLPYKTIDNSPIADAPEWLIDIAKAGRNGDKPGKASATPRTKIIEGEGRNAACLTEQGRLANIYKDTPVVQDMVRAYNQACCVPPLEETELQNTIFKSTDKYVEKAKAKESHALEHFNLTDYGNAERLAAQFKADIRWPAPQKGVRY
ncbi:hypothetical protein ES703_40038 [subsurface metagenome]